MSDSMRLRKMTTIGRTLLYGSKDEDGYVVDPEELPPEVQARLVKIRGELKVLLKRMADDKDRAEHKREGA